MKSSAVKVLSIGVALAVVAGVGYYKYTSAHRTSPLAKTTAKPAQTTTHPQQPAQSSPHTDADLQRIITSWAAQRAFTSSVMAQELNGEQRGASLHATTTMTTASTYKIYVAYATLHQVEQGSITLRTKTRTGDSVNDCLDDMIRESDNDSAEALGFLVGWDTVNTLAAHAGATHTNINNYDSAGQATNGNKQSTAADLTLMVTKLQQGTLLNASDTQLLLGLMKNQQWRERVPAGVPAGVAVADKPGWLSNVENDAAIVYGPKSTYTLVVMTDGSTTQPLADLSRLIYNYLEQ